eukprot:XP_001705584.1 Hypothetical protein GL50803_38221 [Giardia lamblia ATCC 50803]
MLSLACLDNFSGSRLASADATEESTSAAGDPCQDVRDTIE